MAGVIPLLASSVLEGAVIVYAGWELWKLRSPKPKREPSSRIDPERSAGPPGHAVGEHPLDDG